MSNVNIQMPPAGIPSVIVRCPKTDHYFATGDAAETASQSAEAFKDNTSVCPYCHQAHRWGTEAIALDN